MKTKLCYPMLFASALALSACAKNADTNTDTAASSTPVPAAPAATPPAAPAEPPIENAAPATTGAMAEMSSTEHAEMANTRPHRDVPAADQAAAMSVQAGWYTAGIFRACGSEQAMKVDKPAGIDAQIKKGGMSAGDPIYVQLEGMPMGDTYMLTRVAQVGSKTPVRNCPMRGTTTQVGG